MVLIFKNFIFRLFFITQIDIAINNGKLQGSISQ